MGNLAVPKVSIFTDESGELGASLYVLTNPGTIVSGSLNTFASPEGATLLAETSYWVVFQNDSTGATSDNHYRVVTTDSDSEDADQASEWSIGDDRLLRTRDGDAWSTRSDALRIAVLGIINPDAALASLKLDDLDENPVTLYPGFSYRETVYTAYVIPQVYSVTLTVEESDDGATIEYLDKDGDAITDEDTETDGLQLSISEGDTKIIVKVTASDGVTTRTYTVVVTRLKPDRVLVSNAGRPTFDYRTAPGHMQATAFTTGSNVPGYLSNSAEVNLDSDSTDLLVRIIPRGTGNGGPDLENTAETVTLSIPDTIVASRMIPFTAPPGTILKPDTTYHFVITDAAGTGPQQGKATLTRDRDEDPESATDWALAKQILFREDSSDAWMYETNFFIKQRLKGAIIRSTDATLDSLVVEDTNGAAVAITPSFTTEAPNSTIYTARVDYGLDVVTIARPPATQTRASSTKPPSATR